MRRPGAPDKLLARAWLMMLARGAAEDMPFGCEWVRADSGARCALELGPKIEELREGLRSAICGVGVGFPFI